MASNIIKKTGTYRNTSAWETSGALYTCPASTSALILPSLAMKADSSGSSFTIAYTHTSAITSSNYSDKGNYYLYANQANGTTWLTNDGNRQVISGKNVSGNVARYSPATPASGQNVSQVGLEISNDGYYSIPWNNSTNNVSLGIWVMEAGNVLSVACAPNMFASWSFTIFEESFA